MPISEGQKHTVKIATVWSTAIVLGLVHLWRIQDIPWINDEPKLIIKAIVANTTGTWARTGLVGSFGVAYSPIVVWFYQVLLRSTLNIVTVALVKTVLSLALLYGAAAVLQRETKLSLVGIWLILASPYVWFYNRIVWDNVFLIPLSLWLLAIMASFFKAPRAWKVYLAGLICVLLLHVHLMAIIPIFAALITTIVARWKNLRHEWKWYAATVIGVFLLFIPYLLSLRTQEVQKSKMHATEFITSLTASLTGFRFFSHWKFDHFLASGYDTAILSTGKSLTFAAALGLFSMGLTLAVKAWLKIIRDGKKPMQHDWLNAYAAITILGMTIFFLLTRAAPKPHYFNASWGAYLFICWYGLSHILERFKWTFSVYASYVVVMVSMTVMLMVGIHERNGNKLETYGPTLSNQLQMAKTIAPYWPRIELHNPCRFYRHYPHALDSLIALEIKRQEWQQYRGPRKRFTIRFTTDAAQPDGTLEVIELPIPIKAVQTSTPE